MDESVLFPSPNWFLNSCMTVSSDGWLIYGGPSKSLCVLEPIPATYNAVIKEKSYKAHVANKAGLQKVVSVDITPEWPSKRTVLSGNVEGEVKLWTITYDDKNIANLKVSLAHNVHVKEKEEIVSVGYSNETYAITLGCYGNIVKWDISSNVVKTYNTFLKGFKPTCMSCSKHTSLNVAVGTKQGVVFLIDLNGIGKVIYKVRAHDDEILNLSWCPQYEVLVKKQLASVSSVSKRLQSYSDKSNVEVDNVSATPKRAVNNVETPKKAENNVETPKKAENNVETPKKAENNVETPKKAENIVDTPKKAENDAESPKKPEDLDETEVEEDDLFDVYKDHEADEFGHKKYQPEDIYVKVKKDEEKNDFLAECLKLKGDILKLKEEPKPDGSIESLVDALEKAHVKNTEENGSGDHNLKSENVADKSSPSSVHVHRQLLATIGKNGNIHIWSKSGKQVSSCQINHHKYNQKNIHSSSLSMLWYKPDMLLFFDNKGQLLATDPLVMDSKNRLVYRTIDTLHKRNVFAIVSTAPRVQSADTIEQDWPIFTMAQDRVVTEYSLGERRAIQVHGSCGGFVYSIATCPYDPRKIAVSVGDGAVRVWEVETAGDDDSKLVTVRVSSHWQNVLGKVLTAAWHPTRENMLAFATAESRVGLINTSKPDKPAKTLQIASRGAVYSLCWGRGYRLYASGGGELYLYQADKPDHSPTQIEVELEGKRWKINSITYSERGLLVGSHEGSVAALTEEHRVVTAAFPFNKPIHDIEWHPQQVSESDEESPLKNLIAVCSMDKEGQIAILEYTENDGTKLAVWKTLSGHRGAVCRVVWNPHRDGVLMSTSQDATVRVWEVQTGACTAIFGGHQSATLGAAWCALPALHSAALSGGADCALRLWDTADHPAQLYVHDKRPVTAAKKKNKQKKLAAESTEDTSNAPEETNDNSDEDNILATDSLGHKQRSGKKFILSFTNRDVEHHGLEACKMLLNKYLAKNNMSNDGEVAKDDSEGSKPKAKFLKIFGGINDVNEFLDEELSYRLDYGKDEAWIMLSIFRGDIDKVFEFANQRDIICPYLLSIAPCVSFKYWKTATQMYLAQIDRLLARGEQEKLSEVRNYGGPILRKTATLLSIHNVTEAVATLVRHRMFKEAYILCRVRHLDSIAEEILLKWADAARVTGLFSASAVLLLAAGDVSTAAATLARCDSEQHLSLAAELAKISGQTTFADHIATKHDQIKQKNTETEAILETLPSRVECLMKESQQNGNADVEE